jgi:hypothetical protein
LFCFHEKACWIRGKSLEKTLQKDPMALKSADDKSKRLTLPKSCTSALDLS